MDFKPFLEKFIHGDELVKIIWIFMIFHKSLIGIVIGFKITLRLERLRDCLSGFCKTDCDHCPEWLSEISILYFRDLTETIRETTMLTKSF